METWVTIYTFDYPHEAYVIKGHLESEGIAVFLKDENTVQAYNFLSNAIGGVKLQVMEKDMQDAIAIMQEAGYHIETEKPSASFSLLENVTSKIPLLNKLPPIWRILVSAAMITGIVVVIYYLSTRPLPKDALFTHWQITQIDFKQGAANAHTTYFRISFDENDHGEFALHQYDSIQMKDTIISYLDTNVFPFTWEAKGNQLTLEIPTEVDAVFAGEYTFLVKGDSLLLESEDVRIRGYNLLTRYPPGIIMPI